MTTAGMTKETMERLLTIGRTPSQTEELAGEAANVLIEMKTDNTQTLYNALAEIERLQRENEELRSAFNDRVRVIEMQLADKQALERKNEELRKGGLSEWEYEELQALKSQASEPFGYWHQGETYEESGFYLAAMRGEGE